MGEDFIDTHDALQELCDLLSGYQYELHYHDDDEYEYLDEADVCITIPNPYSKNKIYIDLEEEFTLSYGIYHEHYYPNKNDYKEMAKTLIGILNNELCSATMYSGEPLQWLGSTTITKSESSERPIKDVFSFIFKIKEFKTRLNTNGGEVHYNFWNPTDDRIIKLEKKHNSMKEET
ncbi:hypothetical protein [Clostridium sp. AN503]|uniref:hypothetical protein n=1 Tax=Clostridium sp. AN503 TaxID=3160598 RepID=UPI00345846D0